MKPVIYVVDDDDAVRGSVVNLLAAEGFDTSDFATGSAFFAAAKPEAPSCLICDMAMPESTGLDVAAEFANRGLAMPIIFMTGYGTIPLTVQAMKAGAKDFLIKPVNPEQLLVAVREALAFDEASYGRRRELAELRGRYAGLTRREQETMALVIGGLLIKQLAHRLGVSEIMAKIHKRNLMEKMAARSLPDLVRQAEQLGIAKSGSR
ncbi:LuxR family transcriptional regulator [Massilia sp. Root418]|uniref:response regulator transcription factor n=1 Tax=Massilia sp. Root418 TaxID=1736532 RepID=UPI0007007AD4|nr:response regulator [Massilia sp. Root418]KQW93175.1 LuxR family transcriptional regulator [Massilia sp. Root418]